MNIEYELKNFIDHYGLQQTKDALENIENELENKCASGHKQDDDGRCPCVNKDAY